MKKYWFAPTWRKLANLARRPVHRRAAQAAMALIVALGAAVPAQAWVPAPTQILVTNDLGGPVEDRMRRIENMRQRGEGAAIPYGQCISACTLYLGLSQTCVGRSAVFGFHGPAARTQGLGLPFHEFERISHAMASYYPEPVRSWFLSTGRHVIGSYYQVTGAQLIAMGFRECA